MGHLKQPENGWTEDRYAADELPSPAPHAGGVFWGAGKSKRPRVEDKTKIIAKRFVMINSETVLTAGVMSLNFLSAVGIVLVNKALFQWGDGLKFSTLLTAAHFFATAAGIRVCHSLGMYEIKPLKQSQVLPITAAFCAFVVFNNLSLQFNGVSFYQLMKILTTPAVVILQLVFYKVILPMKLALCLVPICAGVALATTRGEDVSVEGAFWATAGLLAAAAYQVLVKRQQAALEVSSLQLLHYQAPQAALLVTLLSPMFDDTGALLLWLAKCNTSMRAVVIGEGDAEAGKPQPAVPESTILLVAMTVLFSCALAFFVNLSLFLVIGRTSPVSYQVLGHFKLVVILAAGITMFKEEAEAMRLLGMALALAGIIGYTSLKRGLGSGWEGNDMKNATKK